MEHEKIERINELTRLSLRAGTDARGACRARGPAPRVTWMVSGRIARAVLENVRLKRPDGTLEPLKKKEDKH